MCRFFSSWDEFMKLVKNGNRWFVKTLAALLLLTPLAFAQASELEPVLGDDGHYQFDWYHQSFLELGDDLDEALAANKVLMVMFVQKGCIYCDKVAKEILTEPAINKYVRENFLVVQLDIFGSRDVTDLDGTTLAENEMSAKWGVVFTPSIYFVPVKTDEASLPEAAAAVMPGAFMKGTFYGMLKWIKTGAYKKEPRFQKYYNDNFKDILAIIKSARNTVE
jgi:thioredoxin-related protein